MSTQISQNYYKRAQNVMVGGVNSPVRSFGKVSGTPLGATPFFTRSAEGPYLYTEEGQRLIDFVGGWGPAILGHAHPQVQQAIQEALARGICFGTPCVYELLLAEAIIEALPWLERIRMCSSGTEACMTALRLARGYTGRDKIVKFSGCYHGHSDSLLIQAGSGALTHGHPDSAGIPLDTAKNTLVAPFNDPQALQSLFEHYPDSIAGVILEPYPANCGLILPLPDYLQHVRDLCTHYGSVLIMDEVMTGFRIGPQGAQGREQVFGDLTILAKIIGGGLPVGALAGKANIMKCLSPEGPVYHAGTLSGNPLSMAAGLATLQVLRKNPPYAYLEALGLQLQQGLQALAHEAQIALQIPRIGSMFSLFFTPHPVHSYEDVLKAPSAPYAQLFHHCLQNGIFLPPSPYETAFLNQAQTEAIVEATLSVMEESIGQKA